MQPEAETVAAPPDRGKIIAAIAGRVSNDAFGTGPLADLRRLDPGGRLAEPTLHRLLARHEVPETWLAGPGLRRWGLMVHAIALAAPDSIGFDTRLGRALFEAGMGEHRFVNLLDSGPEELLDRLPRAVRFLVAKGGRLNPFTAADLVMSADAPDEGFGDRVRQRIAGDYYRAEFRAETSKEDAA